jgi:hypothetical protein
MSGPEIAVKTEGKEPGRFCGIPRADSMAEIEFLEKLPITPAGRIRRYVLRRREEAKA